MVALCQYNSTYWARCSKRSVNSKSTKRKKKKTRVTIELQWKNDDAGSRGGAAFYLGKKYQKNRRRKKRQQGKQCTRSVIVLRTEYQARRICNIPKVTQIVLTKITTETVTCFSVLTSAYQLDFLFLFHHHYRAWLIHLTKYNNKQTIK